MYVTGKSVHRIVDRAKVGVIGIFIFHLYQFKCPVFGTFLNGGKWAEDGIPDVDDQPEEEAKDEVLRMVIVARADSVAMSGEVDGAKWLGVDFVPELEGQIIRGVRELFGSDERHWKEDLTHVNPPSPGRYWYPVWQEPASNVRKIGRSQYTKANLNIPKLWRHWIHGIPTHYT